MKENSLVWLQFAKDDFDYGQDSLKSFEDKYTGMVAYHFQQSAEKSLKAFLVFNGKVVPKTHNLILLLESCAELNIEFQKLRKQASQLNPFSVQTRYPDDCYIHVPLQKAEELLCCCKQIFEFVENKIK